MNVKDEATGQEFDNVFEALDVDPPEWCICPICGGFTDNGHDRMVPPNPYVCSKCEDTNPAA